VRNAPASCGQAWENARLPEAVAEFSGALHSFPMPGPTACAQGFGNGKCLTRKAGPRLSPDVALFY
jgi:hypothetical protein